MALSGATLCYKLAQKLAPRRGIGLNELLGRCHIGLDNYSARITLSVTMAGWLAKCAMA